MTSLKLKSIFFHFFYSLFLSFRSYGFWFFYGKQDIKNKYTRSVIGPIWIVLTLAVTVFAMGPMYKIILNSNNDTYMLHLSTGLVFWFYISGVLSESCSAFISHSGMIKLFNFPLFVYILRVIYRNLIILFYNLSLVFLIYVFSVDNFSLSLILFIPNILLVSILLFLLAYIIGLLCSRFRDLIPLTGSVLQLFMFLSPVFWIPSEALEKSKYLTLNPFNNILRLLRGPFYDEFYYYDVIFCIICITLLFILTLLFFIKLEKKVVYWV